MDGAWWFSWGFFRPGLSPQLPRKIVPKAGASCGAKAIGKSGQRHGIVVNVRTKTAHVGRAPEAGKVFKLTLPTTYTETNVLTPDVDQTFRAGGIRDNFAIWQTLTSDKFILQTIAGVRLEFKETPRQTDRPRPLNFSDYEFDIIDQQIKEFLQLGIVEEATHAQQEFISNVFSRHTRNGASRLILN